MSIGGLPGHAGCRGGDRKAGAAGAATLCAALLLLGAVACAPESSTRSWPMHVVDASSEGADGVKLLDVDGDGLLDASVPWEIGSEVRLYLNPGLEATSGPWPQVRVGSVKGPEDAVPADLDGDGFVDMVSASEGSDVPGGNGVHVHWAPASRAGYRDASQWRTALVPATRDLQCIQAAVFQVDGRHGPDLVVGTYGGPARVVLLRAPEDPRALERWQMTEIHRSGRKVMSLEPHDFDGDGDLDLLWSVAVRDPAEYGLGWLENPGPGPPEAGPWRLHPIGGPGRSVAFAAIGDVDADGSADVVAPQGGELFWYRRGDRDEESWQAHEIPMPPHGGAAKAVAVADVDGDGRNDVVLTRTWNPPAVVLARLLGRQRWGVVWLEAGETPGAPDWRVHDVSGPVGIKFDRVAMTDLDGDGDLDAVTTEEKVDGRGLGVIWYENPER